METIKREQIIEENPGKLSGTPVFKGTRVPVRILYEYLEGGDSIDRFMDHFPTVKRHQVEMVLSLSKDKVLSPDTRNAA